MEGDTKMNNLSSKKSAIACPSTFKTFSLALQALVVLEKQSGKCSSGDMAALLHTDATMLRRILKALVQEHIIEAREGRDGGYRLFKNASDISLAEVYLALRIHSTIADSMIEAARENCVGGQMKNVFSEIMSEIEESTLQVLKSHTIADIAEKMI